MKHSFRDKPFPCALCKARFWRVRANETYCPACADKAGISTLRDIPEPLYELPERSEAEQAAFDRQVAENALEAARAAQRQLWEIERAARAARIQDRLSALWDNFKRNPLVAYVSDDALRHAMHTMAELYESECFPFNFVPPPVPEIEPSQDLQP